MSSCAVLRLPSARLLMLCLLALLMLSCCAPQIDACTTPARFGSRQFCSQRWVSRSWGLVHATMCGCRLLSARSTASRRESGEGLFSPTTSVCSLAALRPGIRCATTVQTSSGASQRAAYVRLGALM
jgi:hypothetical protein